MYVCITAAGTLRSDDGGQTWMPVNKNVAADYLPSPYPEVGQCVHKLLLHPGAAGTPLAAEPLRCVPV